MALTNQQLQDRAEAIETKLNQIQTALNNLASKSQLTALVNIRQQEIVDLQTRVSRFENTGFGAYWEAHDTNEGAHAVFSDRFFTQASFVNSTSGITDAGKPIKLNSNGLIDNSMLPAASAPSVHGNLTSLDADDHTQYLNNARGDARYYTQTQLNAGQLDSLYFKETEFISSSSGALDASKPIKLDLNGLIDSTMIPAIDHNALQNLNSDDHAQYHTDARALTWLGTRSTTDLSEGNNLYYTEVRVSENSDVAANTAARHDAITVTDSATVDFTLTGQQITASVISAGLNLQDISGAVTDAQVPNTITLDNITQITNRSHTSLSDIGANTHAQIDTHIASNHVTSFNTRTGDIIALGSDVVMETIGAATYDTAQKMQDVFHSSGWVSGGAITNNGDGTVSIASGSGYIRSANDALATLYAFNWNASNNITIPLDTIRYIGIEYNAGSPQTVTKTSNNFNHLTDFPLYIVINENNTLYTHDFKPAVGDHVANMIKRTYQTMGLMRGGSGLILSVSGTRNIAVTAGTLWSKLTEFSIDAIDTSVSGSFDRYYQNGSGGWTKEAIQTQWPNTYYDDGSGTLVALGTGKYVNLWFYLETDGSLIMLYGQREDTTLSVATEASPPSSLPLRISNQGMLIGRIIAKQGTDTAAKVDTAFTTQFTIEGVTSHGDLINLTDDDHSQYLNTTRGDARYFQETEFINISSGVSSASKPITLSESGVLHGSLVEDSYIDHGGISGLLDDDHSQYIRVDGSRSFTNEVGGITPSLSSHLTTKSYVDSLHDTSFTSYAPAGTTQTIDLSTGKLHKIDLDSASGDVTLTLSNPTEGKSYGFHITQGTTARNLTWPVDVIWPGGTAPTISTVDNSIDFIQLLYDGTNYLGMFNQDFS